MLTPFLDTNTPSQYSTHNTRSGHPVGSTTTASGGVHLHLSTVPNTACDFHISEPSTSPLFPSVHPTHPGAGSAPYLHPSSYPHPPPHQPAHQPSHHPSHPSMITLSPSGRDVPLATHGLCSAGIVFHFNTSEGHQGVGGVGVVGGLSSEERIHCIATVTDVVGRLLCTWLVHLSDTPAHSMLTY